MSKILKFFNFIFNQNKKCLINFSGDNWKIVLKENFHSVYFYTFFIIPIDNFL